MAVLADADRADLWAQWMRDNTGSVSIAKANIRAAVDALDDFMNANAAAINAALPNPVRTTFTNAQKAHLLMYIIQKRYIKGA